MIDRISRRKGMVQSCCVLLLGLLVLPSCAKQSEPGAASDAGEDLRILYAGHPGSEREADFVTFLQQHFGTVKTADLAAFKESQCDGFDVTILDYDGDGFDTPRPTVSRGFAKPLVTVGVPGGMMSSNWGLKTGYL